MIDPRATPGRLAVVIPAYNAARHLGRVLDRVLAIVPAPDVWVVDDGSADDTARVAVSHGVRLARQWPNQGKGAALRRGFSETGDYELVATLDADGQHDPMDLPRFLEAIETSDCAVGARRLAGRMPALRRIGNQASSWLVSRLAGQPVPDSQSGYRVHRRGLIDAVLPVMPDTGGYLLETEILVRAARMGFRLTSVPIATVYEDEKSYFRPWREMPRFLALFSRLLLDVSTGRASRRADPDRARQAG